MAVTAVADAWAAAATAAAVPAAVKRLALLLVGACCLPLLL
jgi:hypothetical protein